MKDKPRKDKPRKKCERCDGLAVVGERFCGLHKKEVIRAVKAMQPSEAFGGPRRISNFGPKEAAGHRHASQWFRSDMARYGMEDD